MVQGSNRLAIDKVIDALDGLGRLEDTDVALVTSARSLADAVDGQPDDARVA